MNFIPHRKIYCSIQLTKKDQDVDSHLRSLISRPPESTNIIEHKSALIGMGIQMFITEINNFDVKSSREFFAFI